MHLNYLQGKVKVYNGLTLSEVVLNYGAGFALGVIVSFICLLIVLPFSKAIMLSIVSGIALIIPIGFVLSKFNLSNLFWAKDIQYSGRWTGGW
jgi:hypothetical protein